LVAIAIFVSKLSALLALERESSSKDQLTGLPNRRAFYAQFSAIIGLCGRLKQPVTLAYIDLDNFKEVNDQLGHKQGDDVLLDAARIFKQNVRASDIVGRFGGDEFAVLLPNCDQNSARNLLAKVGGCVKDEMSKNHLNVTASIGAITFSANNCEIEDILHKADQVMYKVKNSGKNSVLVEAS